MLRYIYIRTADIFASRASDEDRSPFGLRSATQFDSGLSSTRSDSFIGITADNIAVDPALNRDWRRLSLLQRAVYSRASYSASSVLFD